MDLDDIMEILKGVFIVISECFFLYWDLILCILNI